MKKSDFVSFVISQKPITGEHIITATDVSGTVHEMPLHEWESLPA